MPPGWCKFLRVYKVLRTGIPGIAKCCFTNGFLEFWIGAFGASDANRRQVSRKILVQNGGTPVQGLPVESRDLRVQGLPGGGVGLRS